MTKCFWAYAASDATPSLAAAIEAAAISSATTSEEWDKLSPGMRREIVRQARRKVVVDIRPDMPEYSDIKEE